MSGTQQGNTGGGLTGGGGGGGQQLTLCSGLWGMTLLDVTEPGGGGGPDPPVVVPTGVSGYMGIYSPNHQQQVQAPVQLELQRTHRQTGDPLQAAAGYCWEGGRTLYNGAGSLEPPAGKLPSSRDGEGFTLAIRWHAGAGGLPADQPDGGPMSTPQQLLGLRGEWAANPTQSSGVRVVIHDPSAAAWEVRVHRQGLAQVIAGTLDPTPAGLFLVVAVFRRVGGLVQLRLFANGTRLGNSDVPLDPATLEVDRVTFGDVVQSDGALEQVALWCRALTDAEVEQLGDSLDALTVCHGHAGGGGEPLLDDCGGVLINPTFTVPRTDRVAVLEAEGVHRHTRLLDQYHPRSYVLRWEHDNGADLERVLLALELSRGGCLPVRWRHPKDDPPGTVSTAPRWLIKNADELQQLVANRARGGHVVRYELHLEEVL